MYYYYKYFQPPGSKRSVKPWDLGNTPHLYSTGEPTSRQHSTPLQHWWTKHQATLHTPTALVNQPPGNTPHFYSGGEPTTRQHPTPLQPWRTNHQATLPPSTTLANQPPDPLKWGSASRAGWPSAGSAGGVGLATPGSSLGRGSTGSPCMTGPPPSTSLGADSTDSSADTQAAA